MSLRAIAAGILILAVWGCQSTPAPTEPRPDAPDLAAVSPGELLDRAARAGGPRASRLYLRAAERLADEDAPAADDALAAVRPEDLDTSETARYLLVRARVALARDDLEGARTLLLAVDAEALPVPTEAALVNARILAAEGSFAAAAEHLIDWEPAPEQRQRLNDAIWDHLGRVPAFQALAMPSRTGGEARGWWQLKVHMLRSFTLADQRRRLESWRTEWSGHPAAERPPANLQRLREESPAVTRVGLMLPLSGPLRRAGRAVRDAFIAAYLSRRDEVDYEIRIYDTAAAPLGTLYEQALVDGADVLVGPLRKETVAEMNGLEPEIPVLALNYLEEGRPASRMLQLGLAIEDDAASLRQWLQESGAERLVVFRNDDDWSVRASEALASSWQGPLHVQPLDSIRTVTEGVGAAMRVTSSRERHAALEKLLGTELEFVPRARADTDAIVALVTPVEANALVPALEFHFTDHLPVFATSQTIRGAGAERMATMDGFHVGELPWFVVQDGAYATLNRAFDLEGSAFVSLYALGVDAFRLADRLPGLAGGHFTELLGSTGELSLAADGRIQRRLARTQVRGATLERVTGSHGR
ncbi:MAG: penicillin-binding protein activator [Pseudomonadota bacterium]